MQPLIEALSEALKEHHLLCRIVSVRRLQDLQNALEKLHAEALFDASFYQERLTFFDFQHPVDLPTTASIIIVAAPHPQTRVVFNHNETSLELIIPPTYVGYNRRRQEIGALLDSLLAPHGYLTVSAKLPLKNLAVRSGLCEYGHNNIAYTPGMGSFFQLVAFFSDLPCPQDAWREPLMLERCQNCKACIHHCPTGAITPDRFLLHAERCLVFHNEKPADQPFPAWIDPSTHNCLIGCMSCQNICPENKPYLGWIEPGEVFSDQETTLLLQGVSPDRLPTETRKKLERLDLFDDVEMLPRNLGVFFEKN